MAFSLRGIKVPHRKNTAGMSAVRMPVPQTVIIPMDMHIGKPAIPVVKVGDHVNVGTLIGEQNGFIGSPAYSSVSGTVKKIEDMLLSNGNKAPSIFIESDGEMTPDSSIAPPVINSKADFINAVKHSGIVGLGGAGFPTYVKLSTESDVDTLVINGAECEPYITSDSIVMTERSDDVFRAVEMADKYFNFDKIIIGIEQNKPQAIASMKKLTELNPKIQVKILPSVYPQGGEKVLIYHTTGRVVGAGMLPSDLGCIVLNSTTVANIGRYLETGMPLIEKTVTVDGGAVKEPKNVIAPVGALMRDVFDFCGGFKCDPAKVLYGGPMMGIAVPDLEQPILKQTNAVLALDEKEIKKPKTTACIRCGACVNNCPFGINVPAISKGYQNADADMMLKAGAEVCMECGCCSYVCPANRPLVQTNKLAKMYLKENKEKEGNK